MKKTWLSVIVMVLLIGITQISLAQGPGPGGRRGGANAPGGPAMDPVAMQARMVEGYKTTLAATDDEWKAIQPLLTKVVAVQAKSRPTRGPMPNRRGPAPVVSDNAAVPGVVVPTPAPTGNVEQDALQQVLDSPISTPADVAAKLKAYRDARAKVEAELKTAREDLRKVLTPKQEARLVLVGVLD